MLLGLLALHTQPLAIAQEGTPTAEGFEFAPGVIGYELARAEGQEQPSLYRLTFAPGATLSGGDADPSIALALVEAGSLTVTIDAPIAITRGGDAGTPEVVEAGTEFTAEAGDYLVIPPLVAGEYRNDGPEEASVVVAAIMPSGTATSAMGTPEA
jgi:quercetin dioxygenase-like cupin family protein